eukprot:TRINITY_DN3031_c4_g1_i1.p1 TRINITY_DN3031_c4_g1~~TRINITY_DN3031_c4_g1_i1.p1  ORF type:complete len:379 (-),score=42.17 TRINITY_DN3031_c4_g1_i1:246-1382(-)
MEYWKNLRDDRKWVGLLGLSFFSMFTCFNAVQTLQSTINKTLGSLTLASLYACFAIGNIITPIILSKLDVRKCFWLGGAGYILFIIANIKIIPPLLILAGGLNGLSAAIIWNAQSVYVSRWTPDGSEGKNSGLFNGIMFMNMVFGNIIVATLFKFEIKNAIVFSILAVPAAMAVISMGFLKTPKISEDALDRELTLDGSSSPSTYTTNEDVNIKEKLLEMFSMFKSKHLLLIVPLIAYRGLGYGYILGVFPNFIDSKIYIGYIMAVYGVGSIVGSYGAGYLFDRVVDRRNLLLLPCVVIFSTNIGILVLMDPEVLRAHLYSFFFISFGFGLCDSSVSVCLYHTFLSTFSDKPSPAFSGINYVLCRLVLFSLYIISTDL